MVLLTFEVFFALFILLLAALLLLCILSRPVSDAVDRKLSRPCPRCYTTGWYYAEPCRACQGSGYVTVFEVAALGLRKRLRRTTRWLAAAPARLRTPFRSGGK